MKTKCARKLGVRSELFKRSACCLCLLFLASGCASADLSARFGKDYKRAIAEAVDDGAPEGRHSLERCVSSWSNPWLAEKRSNFLDGLEFSSDSNSDNWVFLEIGSEGYERYDFIFVRDMRLSSSFGDPVDISLSFSGNFLNQIYRDGAVGFFGNAQISADDASCYFLTISFDGKEKSYALKGPIMDDRLLGMVRKNDRDIYRSIMQSQLVALIRALINDASQR